MLRRAIPAFCFLTCLASAAAMGQSKKTSVTTAQAPREIVVCFAWVDSGKVRPGSPAWVAKWARKNAKRFPRVRFSDKPALGADNYLVVLSSDASALRGFDPVTKFVTTETDTDFSGNGTALSGGEVWSFDFSGTATTMSTTAVQEDVPYTIEKNTLYAVAYSSTGVMISRHEEVDAWQRGGNTAGEATFNLGNLLRRIGAKDRLLRAVVADISRTN